jgi:chromosome segregation ATPase
MIDDINKKIIVDVEINADGQQQITQYKSAFDNFKNAINNLKSPLSNISTDFKTLNKGIEDINGTLNKLNNAAAAFNSTGGKIGGIVSNTIGGFGALKEMLKGLGITFEAFEAQITAGLSLLISFLPVIIDWVSDLFSADKATKSLNQTLKEHKAVFDAVKQAHLQGAQDAQEELIHLKLLYNASQDHNLSLAQRKKAVEDLQSQYPAYFGNLSQEAILTGRAAGQYKDLAKAFTSPQGLSQRTLSTDFRIAAIAELLQSNNMAISAEDPEYGF